MNACKQLRNLSTVWHWLHLVSVSLLVQRKKNWVFVLFFSSLPCYYFLSPVSTSSTPTLTGHCRHRKDDEDSPEARRSLRAQNDQSSRVKPPNKTSSISCFANHCFPLSVETHTHRHTERQRLTLWCRSQVPQIFLKWRCLLRRFESAVVNNVCFCFPQIAGEESAA